jgi:hypothetical protein
VKTPAQPTRLSFRTNFAPDRLEVDIPAGSRTVGCFMFVWLLGWTGGCGFLIWRIREDPQWTTLLFGIPFWVSWIFVVVLTIKTFLGREVFTLDIRGASYRRRTLCFTDRRATMRIDELIRFGTAEEDYHSDSQLGSVVVNLQTIGQPIRFGSTLGHLERVWLVYVLQEKLREWQKAEGRKSSLPHDAATITFGKPLVGELLNDQSKQRNAVRTANDSAVEPPSDTHWRVRDDFESVLFRSRGRFHLGAIGGVTFLALFINGIIGVFAKQLYWPDEGERMYGIEWLYRFVFLIPFELVGLAVLLVWLFVVIEPLRLRSWRVYAERIVWKFAWLGIGFRKTYRVERIERLEVRRVKPWNPKTKPAENVGEPADAKSRITGFSPAALTAPQGSPTFEVVFIDGANRDAAKIEGLTLGEACWMADTLLRTHPNWVG